MLSAFGLGRANNFAGEIGVSDNNRHPAAQEMRLSELLGALSMALDLTEGQPEGHSMRCCWIGMHIGRAMGLSDAALSDLYYTLLLKDLGCSSNAARICSHYLTDDLTFKRDFKLVNGSLAQAMKFVLSHTGMKAGMAARFGAIIKGIQNSGDIACELIDTRCTRGSNIARRMRFSEDVAQGIQYLDEHWDGSGLPKGASGSFIPLNARIALLSQVVDVFHTASGPGAACQEVGNRSGSWFDPRVVAAFEQISSDVDFWMMLQSTEIDEAVFALEPQKIARKVSEDYLDEVAAAFAQVIDAKSTFTSNHSERVMRYTDMIAEEMGCSDEKRRFLRRAALLHDIGKLGVSNAILDKPGKLDDEEWEQMKMHALNSEAILSRVGAFVDLAPIAGAHHERLDGTGYPYGLQGSEITMDTRILTTADIFDALSAERPYRGAMAVSQALDIMAQMVGTAIDEDCFKALSRAMERAGELQVA